MVAVSELLPFFNIHVIMSRKSFRVNPHFIVCLNVKELLAQSRRHIWSLSGSNGIRTHNHLVRKQIDMEYGRNRYERCICFYIFVTVMGLKNSLAKYLSVRLRTKWLWVRIPLLSLKLKIWCLLRAKSSLTFRQMIGCVFALTLLRDMIITHSQMHRTYKYSQHSSMN